MTAAVTVWAPGSSANLGPGYDMLAGALNVGIELSVRRTGVFAVEVGELSVPADRDNLCVRGFEAVAPADEVAFKVSGTLPIAAGFGSSGAAIVAGALAATALAGQAPDPAEIAALASKIEGHPDNVAASVYGGFVVCSGSTVERIAVPSGLSALLVAPHEAVPTAAARAAMPRAVVVEDVVYNLGHVATLVLGLERGDLELVAAGLRDRIHQPARARLYPRSAVLSERAAEFGALGATISGAGPSVLYWVTAEGSREVSERLRAETEGWAEVYECVFASTGARATSQ